MRLFIGLKLPNQIKLELCKAQSAIKKLDLIEGNFVRPNNLHLTLKFIGNLEERELDLLIDALAKVEEQPFMARLCELDYFPKEKKARLIWARLSGKNLFDLAQKINISCKNFAALSSKPFLSHITLVRIKKVINTKNLKDIIGYTKLKPKDFKVKYFSLFKSENKNGKLIYVELACFLLLK